MTKRDASEGQAPRPEPVSPTASRWRMYVLRCVDDSLYTGITTDLERRLEEHQSGAGARYTRARLPVAVVGSWAYPDRSGASRAEAAFKKLRRADKLHYLEHPGAW